MTWSINLNFRRSQSIKKVSKKRFEKGVATMTQMTIETPCGEFALLDRRDHLMVACMADHRPIYGHLFAEASTIPSPLLIKAAKQLREYFTGQRFHFDIPLGLNVFDWDMGTPFEKRAWQTLSRIAYGRMISYKEQALWMGNPKAIRAVGRANGKNPLSIFVPCHRVVGSNGALTGYAGGLEMKDFLLKLEAKGVDSPLMRAREHHFAVLK
jgi:methylated-DNA-[protein]-cysteine S-methyltransferase